MGYSGLPNNGRLEQLVLQIGLFATTLLSALAFQNVESHNSPFGLRLSPMSYVLGTFRYPCLRVGQRRKTDIAKGPGRADFVAKLDDKPLARNNRILAHKVWINIAHWRPLLNQYCSF